jgi:2-hydroxy-3-keto-5-methylthiopentenyl-1-phosphate phosphatase
VLNLFKCDFRNNVSNLLSKIATNNIPYIVFCKGFGDIIEFVLENQMERIPEKFHIVSNMMIFNENVSLHQTLI